MTYNTRIQLKSDTEDNWKKVGSTFIPLAGELIIYNPDNTHPSPRVKIGDGVTPVGTLFFIDAGTIDGNAVEIVKIANFDDRPSPGSPDKLYIDLSTNAIYHYDGASGYTQLSNFNLSTTTTQVSKINNWRAGVMTNITVENNTLKIQNGQTPQLSYYDTLAVNGVTQTLNNTP